MASQLAFALFGEYNKKIGINRRFKYIINFRIELAIKLIDYEIYKMSVYLA
jgi:hypothetical protein